jgi:hypothetical protein
MIWTGFFWLKRGTGGGLYEHDKEPNSTEGVSFSDQLSDYQLVKVGFFPLNYLELDLTHI